MPLPRSVRDDVHGHREEEYAKEIREEVRKNTEGIRRQAEEIRTLDKNVQDVKQQVSEVGVPEIMARCIYITSQSPCLLSFLPLCLLLPPPLWEQIRPSVFDTRECGFFGQLNHKMDSIHALLLEGLRSNRSLHKPLLDVAPSDLHSTVDLQTFDGVEGDLLGSYGQAPLGLGALGGVEHHSSFWPDFSSGSEIHEAQGEEGELRSCARDVEVGGACYVSMFHCGNPSSPYPLRRH